MYYTNIYTYIRVHFTIVTLPVRKPISRSRVAATAHAAKSLYTRALRPDAFRYNLMTVP